MKKKLNINNKDQQYQNSRILEFKILNYENSKIQNIEENLIIEKFRNSKIKKILCRFTNIVCTIIRALLINYNTPLYFFESS